MWRVLNKKTSESIKSLSKPARNTYNLYVTNERKFCIDANSGS